MDATHLQNAPLGVICVKGRSYNGALDLVDAFEAHGRVTVGYLPWKTDPAMLRDRMDAGEAVPSSECFLDDSEALTALFVGDFGEEREKSRKNLQLQIAKSRGLGREVRDGWFVVIPRGSEFWLGRVAGRKRFWDVSISDVLSARVKSALQGIEGGVSNGAFHEVNLHAQICQGWPLEPLPGGVGYLRRVPLHNLPASIRKTVASRQGHCRVRLTDEAHLTWVLRYLAQLFRGGIAERPSWTDDPLECLRFILTPATFEHLCVDLLNSHDPSTLWLHVGGAGDGGLDGVGFSRSGEVEGVLQCKYELNRPEEVLNELKQTRPAKGTLPSRRILATLSRSANVPIADGVSVWSGENIVDMCRTYAHVIPVLKKVVFQLSDLPPSEGSTQVCL